MRGMVDNCWRWAQSDVNHDVLHSAVVHIGLLAHTDSDETHWCCSCYDIVARRCVKSRCDWMCRVCQQCFHFWVGRWFSWLRKSLLLCWAHSVCLSARWARKQNRQCQKSVSVDLWTSTFYQEFWVWLTSYSPPLELLLTTSELWFGQEQEGILP